MNGQLNDGDSDHGAFVDADTFELVELLNGEAVGNSISRLLLNSHNSH